LPTWRLAKDTLFQIRLKCLLNLRLIWRDCDWLGGPATTRAEAAGRPRTSRLRAITGETETQEGGGPKSAPFCILAAPRSLSVDVPATAI
jgi:hypothetical protein